MRYSRCIRLCSSTPNVPISRPQSEFSESSLEDNAFTATYALQREDQPAPPVTPAPPAFSTLEPDPSLPADDSLPTDATLVIDAAALPEPADPTPSPARAQPSPAALSAERQDEANAVEEAGGGSGEGRGGPPRVDGFVAMPKVDWPGAYDYPCPRSDWPGGCRIRDTLSAVAAECVGDPRCHGFVFLPREGASPGSDADGVGFLKEGPLDVR